MSRWVSQYDLSVVSPKNIGLVMAGNIPLVGFHDMLATLLSGHRLVAKPSSQDVYLIGYMIEHLIAIEPGFKDIIVLQETLKKVDAVIATGSDNTARYFEYYFRNIPHVIRKNRSSCAIMTGNETNEDLEALGVDVFSFFGLGCRNVSKLFIPAGYDITSLFQSWKKYEAVINHHKYANNYDYNKSILLVNRTPFYDNGFALVTESHDLVSPISVLFYESYEQQSDLNRMIGGAQSKIQCVVGTNGSLTTVPFGKAQFPELDDYADGVDTMEFLAKLR